MGRPKAAPVFIQGTVSNVIDDAMGMFQELRDEMQSWLDNLPENLQNGSKGEAIQECIDSLEQFCDETFAMVPGADELEMSYQELGKRPSRHDRCVHAADMLRSAADVMREKVEEEREAMQEAEGRGEKYDPPFSIEDAEYSADEIERVADDADSVEFPGMYG